MNKNNIIGFSLIAVVLIAFSWFNQPSAEQIEAQMKQDSIEHAQQLKAQQAQKLAEQTRKAEAEAAAKGDTTNVFHAALNGENQDIVLKNQKLELTISTKGGMLSKAVIKDFTGHHKNQEGKYDPALDTQDLTLFERQDQSLNFLLAGKADNIITKEMFFTNLIMRGGTRLTTGGCGDGEMPHQIQGRLRLPDANVEVPFVGGVDRSRTPVRHTTYNIEAAVIGNGWLNFGGADMETDFFVTSTNSAFKGKMSIGVGVHTGCRSAICFWHPEALGGPLDSYDYRGIWARSANSGIKPMESMTYNVANRGLFFDELGEFIETPEGVEFKFMNNVITRKGFRKIGAGTLALGGTVLVGGSPSDATPTGNGERNKIDIEEGYLKSVNTNSYANLHMTFSDGAGIAIDATPSDSDVAAFGLFSPNAGLFVANGSIKVRLDGADALFASRETIRVPVCTVDGNTADLSNVLVGVRPKGYACRIEKETLVSGLIRYNATFVPQGTKIMFR